MTQAMTTCPVCLVDGVRTRLHNGACWKHGAVGEWTGAPVTTPLIAPPPAIKPQRPPLGILRERQPDGFERVQLYTAAYDFRAISNGHYGQHVAEFYFGLVGPNGAVSLRIFSGWAHGAFHEDGRPNYDYHSASAPCGAGISIHHRPVDGLPGELCSFLGLCAGGDVSFMASDPIWRVLVQEGWEPMWAQLRAWYDQPATWERS